jgi:hypothetical protein
MNFNNHFFLFCFIAFLNQLYLSHLTLVQELKSSLQDSSKVFGELIRDTQLTEVAVENELPFQNREEEIKQIAEICLRNMRFAKIISAASYEASTYRLTQLCSAQMWGSGKSWLAGHFLEQFRSESYAEYRNTLKKEYSPELVQELENAKYVLVDFREYSALMKRSVNLREFVTLCVVTSLVPFLMKLITGLMKNSLHGPLQELFMSSQSSTSREFIYILMSWINFLVWNPE